MSHKGGQGLPLNVIVLAAISVIVLVMFIAFATGSFSKLFKGTETLGEAVTPEQIATFRIGCEQACFQAKQLADSPEEWNSSTYCCRTLNISNVITHCYENPVGVECGKETSIG